MRTTNLIILFLFLAILPQFSGAQTSSLSINTYINPKFKKFLRPNGRLFLFISDSRMAEPRKNNWPGKGNMIFAVNIDSKELIKSFTFDNTKQLTKSVNIPLDSIPNGTYTIQVLWDQNIEEFGINEPGNLYSDPLKIELKNNTQFTLPLKNNIKSENLTSHPLLKEVSFKSKVLSKWWGKEIFLKAAVLLPSDFYKKPDKKFPVRYNIAGYGGRYTRVNRLINWDKKFINWWQSETAPQIISVYLDGKGPFGDCYQINSQNNGPYGTALTEELIPYIEQQFRAIGTTETRFVEGCSTGGWVSLALQLFYPDYFGGCFSYSPDPVDFTNFQLINIYLDKNAFVNEYGYLRPIVRDISGEPVISQKDFIQFENVMGSNDTYITSGGQYCAFTALFSPKGDNGLPIPLFDPYTGAINREVAEHWKKYDLKIYVEKNWEKLAPKVKGKIWIWMGDMDHFYLNKALKEFYEMVITQKEPKSDATIIFTPYKGHCSGYNEKNVILQINDKLNN